jgi:hypothetical protein
MTSPFLIILTLWIKFNSMFMLTFPIYIGMFYGILKLIPILAFAYIMALTFILI